jgi:hypothetical protein
MRKVKRFYAGDRVVVSKEYHWAQFATGKVKENPRLGNYNQEWKGCPRTMHGPNGPLFYYWVEFDSPQKGEKGHEYYREGEIEAGYLQKLEE